MKTLAILVMSLALPVFSHASEKSVSVEVFSNRAVINITGQDAEKLFDGMTESLEKEQIETTGTVVRSGKDIDCIQRISGKSVLVNCFIHLNNLSQGEI